MGSVSIPTWGTQRRDPSIILTVLALSHLITEASLDFLGPWCTDCWMYKLKWQRLKQHWSGRGWMPILHLQSHLHNIEVKGSCHIRRNSSAKISDILDKVWGSRKYLSPILHLNLFHIETITEGPFKNDHAWLNASGSLTALMERSWTDLFLGEQL